MLPTPRRDKVASEKWAHNGVQARGEEAAEPWLGWGSQSWRVRVAVYTDGMETWALELTAWTLTLSKLLNEPLWALASSFTMDDKPQLYFEA